MVGLSKKKKVIYSIIGSISLFLVISICLLVYMLKAGSHYMVFTVNSPSYVIDKVRAAEKSNGLVELGEGEVNAIIQLYTKKLDSNRKIAVKDVYAHVNDANIVFYGKATYKNLSFLVSCSGEISYKDNFIVFKPSEIKVGKLKIPISTAFKYGKNYSNSEFQIKNDCIYISKNVLPFNLVTLDVSKGNITASIEKLIVQEQQPAKAPETPGVKNNEPSKTTENTRQNVLKRASGQLGSVIRDIESQEGKSIISTIQNVVNKMISNSSYDYKAEADQIKSRYSKLPQNEKEDIKDAILMNMDTATLREIKNTFGL